MAIKKCCNCNDGKFQSDMFGDTEYICKYKKDKRVDYSGKCVYGLKQEKNFVRIN